MNRGQIRTEASLLCSDPDQTRFAGKYNDAMNRAQEQFAVDSLALFKDNTITLVDGTASYDLPSDFMLEKLVKHKEIKLDPVSRATILYYQDRDWTLDTGTPKKYNIDPEEARKKILVYPTPTADDAGANLVLTYYPFPAEMDDDSDVPLNSSSLLVSYHMGLAAWTAWHLLGFDQATNENVKKRIDLKKDYDAKVVEARDRFGNTASEPWVLRGGRFWRW